MSCNSDLSDYSSDEEVSTKPKGLANLSMVNVGRGLNRMKDTEEKLLGEVTNNSFFLLLTFLKNRM